MPNSAIAAAVREILAQVGEDPEREGLRDTPDRVSKMYAELLAGYQTDPAAVVNGALFEVPYDEMIVVRDIEFYSLCLPSRQLVDAVGGQQHAADIQVGTQLYTLHEGRRTTTRVVSVRSRPALELVELTPRRSDGSPGTPIQLTPEHPVMTPQGWREAGELRPGNCAEYLEPRQADPKRYPVREGYDREGVLGAAADASIQELYVAKRWTQAGWYGRHGFTPETTPYNLRDSAYVEIADVNRQTAREHKPFTVYSFQCEPYPSFCVGGILTHNCEHHLLPFVGHADVAYIPKGRVLGLSKIPRVVDMYARRLQVQERMTGQIADFLVEVLQPLGVAVVLEASHLCAMMRGVKKAEALMVTSAMRGIFRRNATTRAEFMAHIQRPAHKEI